MLVYSAFSDLYEDELRSLRVPHLMKGINPLDLVSELEKIIGPIDARPE